MNFLQTQEARTSMEMLKGVHVETNSQTLLKNVTPCHLTAVTVPCSVKKSSSTSVITWLMAFSLDLNGQLVIDSLYDLRPSTEYTLLYFICLFLW